MRVTVRVVVRSSRVRVEGGEPVRVYLTQPAEGGRANEQLREALSAHYGVKKYQITIVSGTTSRTKVVEIAE